MRRAQLNHIACVMPSADKAGAVARNIGFAVGEPDHFEGEGTKEIYVGDPATRTSTLLLMEPTRPGSYQNALRKRGPGLHHIAVDVTDIEAYIMECKGWLLHPNSLKTIPRLKTAYLARPGFPALIEVQEKKEILGREAFLSRLELPLLPEQKDLLTVLGVAELGFSPDTNFWATVGAQRFPLASLWAQ